MNYMSLTELLEVFSDQQSRMKFGGLSLVSAWQEILEAWDRYTKANVNFMDRRDFILNKKIIENLTNHLKSYNESLTKDSLPIVAARNLHNQLFSKLESTKGRFFKTEIKEEQGMVRECAVSWI